MARYPDFFAAKRPDQTDFVGAAAYQRALNQEERAYKDQQMRDNLELPEALYGTYSDVTETNPIAEALERNRIKKLPTESAQPGALTNNPGQTTVGPQSLPNGTTRPPGTNTAPQIPTTPMQPPVPEKIPVPAGGPKVYDNRVAGSGRGAGGRAGATDPFEMLASQNTVNPASASSMMGAGGGIAPAPVSSALPGAGMASRAPLMAASGGGDVAASLGANSAATAGSAAIPIVGGLIGAGTSYATGGSDEDTIKSGVGGAATGALATYGAPMAAAGPIGWAGIAALSAASLYGMFG